LGRSTTSPTRRSDKSMPLMTSASFLVSRTCTRIPISTNVRRVCVVQAPYGFAVGVKGLCRGFCRVVAENQENDAQLSEHSNGCACDLSLRRDHLPRTFVRRPCRAPQLFRLPVREPPRGSS